MTHVCDTRHRVELQITGRGGSVHTFLLMGGQVLGMASDSANCWWTGGCPGEW